MMADNNPRGSLFVGEGVIVRGTFEVPEMAVVAGLVEGELNTKEVLVDTSGIVNGRINAEVVEVRGEVTQGLNVTNHLNVRSSAKITGLTQYAEMSVEKGAKLSGELRLIDAPIPSVRQPLTEVDIHPKDEISDID
ncbi:polymer-forming cytoskeletal protein [Polynucleobacter sp. Adler-ghost]|jgi:cytoskeletal protein CcmA (bactofilin family)|uniref:bactofilin family protein n=1 Tax=Polynucleobacter sp. Adler-ghost TaxID=2770234 RepID=UPI001BFD9B66|nr:polymer-forming cytoskeletal protein [Polynucleobacter sp. Adler-ghost]QWE31135.1 polymer-forming cytoskeletal protein [Polynucleobacter sp. Adler-ghost]